MCGDGLQILMFTMLTGICLTRSGAQRQCIQILDFPNSHVWQLCISLTEKQIALFCTGINVKQSNVAHLSRLQLKISNCVQDYFQVGFCDTTCLSYVLFEELEAISYDIHNTFCISNCMYWISHIDKETAGRVIIKQTGARARTGVQSATAAATC